MKHYSTFIFDSVSLHGNTISMRYSLNDEVRFEEELILPAGLWKTEYKKTPALTAALECLHMLGGVSYYKTCLPKNIVVRTGDLSRRQAAFFESVYENGLGEFFFKNNIDFRDLIHFPSADKETPDIQPPQGKAHKRILVPIGGGKDSLVTAELLKKAGHAVTLLRMGSHPLITELAKIAGLPLITIERKLSPALFALNAEGALNGHVPITAYLSSVAVVVAMLGEFDAVVLSNERSANYGNVELFGKEINHQWSKSLEFERAFQSYLSDFVTKDIAYFSLLRPLSELHISKLFSQYPQYVSHATSCNTNWRILKEKPTERWCKQCPKCAFAFVMFAPFIEEQKLIDMFGGNLFADASLLPLFKELLGIEGIKPFECVGTPEETKAALFLAHKAGSFAGTPVMQMFEKEILPSMKKPEDLMHECFTPSEEHVTPKEFTNVIF